MMKKILGLATVGVIVAFLMVFGLTDGSRCPDLSESQKENLVAEATLIFADFDADPEAKRYSEINPVHYPHLSGLAPKKVTLRNEGLYIRMKEGFVTECGYFIPSAPTNQAEFDASTDPSYKKTGSAFYIYRIRG